MINTIETKNKIKNMVTVSVWLNLLSVSRHIKVCSEGHNDLRKNVQSELNTKGFSLHYVLREMLTAMLVQLNQEYTT